MFLFFFILFILFQSNNNNINQIHFLLFFFFIYSDPKGAHVGQNYTEWFAPAKTIGQDESFVPPLLPNGYYKAQKEKIDADNAQKKLLQERKARIARRQAICELCDSAILTGRTILKNEEKSNNLKEKKGLVTLVKMTCNAIVENYKVEVPWMNCGHVSEQIWNHYDDKYVGNVKVPAKCQGECPKHKKVNFALVASLQNCQTLVGVTFCDAVQSLPIPLPRSQPHDGILETKPTTANACMHLGTLGCCDGLICDGLKWKRQCCEGLMCYKDSNAGPTCIQNIPSQQIQLPTPVVPVVKGIEASNHKSTWSEFGIPPAPQPALPAPHTSVQPGPVIQTLEPSNCECDCCQQKVDPCTSCPTDSTTTPVDLHFPIPSTPPTSTAMPPLAPCQNDPCDSGVDADLIFTMTGVDAGALTEDVKKSIVHLFSAILVVDDTRITLTDLANAQFDSSDTSNTSNNGNNGNNGNDDPVPTPPTSPTSPALIASPTVACTPPCQQEQQEQQEEQEEQEEQVVAAPIVIDASMAPIETAGQGSQTDTIVQNVRRRRLLMLDNLDLEKTPPAESAIPVPIVAPPQPLPTPYV